MEMNQIITISTDSEETVSDKMVGVEYGRLQSDAESKVSIPDASVIVPSSKADSSPLQVDSL